MAPTSTTASRATSAATTSSAAATAREIVEAYRAETGPSARSLITTVFGDALLPRRQPIAVQDLATLVAPLGINERAVRTALHRLGVDGLVESERRGRRAFYRVATAAEGTFANADARIYARPDVAWDGDWTVAVVEPHGTRAEPAHGAAEGAADELRRRLTWLGLAEPTTGVLVSPTVAPEAVLDVAHQLDGRLLALTRGPLTGGTLGDETTRRALVDPDGRLAERHRRHLDVFTPALASAHRLAPTDAFALRIAVVDSWRRLALRTPLVPRRLEPADWPAAEGFDLTLALHRRTGTAAEQHLDDLLGEAGHPGRTVAA